MFEIKQAIFQIYLIKEVQKEKGSWNANHQRSNNETKSINIMQDYLLVN